MIPSEVFISWLIFLDILTLTVFFGVIFKLPSSKAKKALLLLIIVNFSYFNPLLLFRILQFSERIAIILSRVIFASGVLIVSSYAYIILIFCGLDTEKKHSWYWIFQINSAVLFFLSLTGYIESGVVLTEYGFAPVHAPLYLYYSISIILFGCYVFGLLLNTLRKTTNEILKYQLQIIFFTGILSFTGLIITNILIQIIYSSSKYAPLGSIWLLFFLSGILYIVTHGQSLFLKKNF